MHKFWLLCNEDGISVLIRGHFHMWIVFYKKINDMLNWSSNHLIFQLASVWKISYKWWYPHISKSSNNFQRTKLYNSDRINWLNMELLQKALFNLPRGNDSSGRRKWKLLYYSIIQMNIFWYLPGNAMRNYILIRLHLFFFA